MATSGSFNTSAYTTNGKTRYLTFSWERTSHSVEDNTTTISYTLKGNGTYTGWMNTRSIKLIIDGTTVYTASGPIKVYNGTVLKSGTITISHNDKGEKSFSAYVESAIYDFAINCTGSKEWELDAIPRKSSVTATSGDIGSKTTITIARASSSFTHTLTWSCLGLSGTFATKTDKTSIDAEIPTSICAKIPNDPSATVTVTCETFNGTKSLGSTTCTFTATVGKDYEPRVTYLTLYDINEKTKAVTKDKTKFVKGVSNAQISGVDVETYGEATIKSIVFKCDNKSADVVDGKATINAVTSGKFTVTATDSRGHSTTLPLDATMYDYYAPTFNLRCYRPQQTGNIVKAEISGKFCNNEISNGLAIEYLCVEGEERQCGGSLEPTIDGNEFSVSSSLGEGIFEFDYREECVVKITVTDVLSEISKTITLIKGEPIFDYGKDDFNFNVPVFYKGSPITVDFIIEQGTDGIWTYRKWYSGIAECWGIYTQTNVAVNNAWGSLFESNGYYIDLPSGLFIETPVFNILLTGSGEEGSGAMCETYSRGSKDESPLICAIRPNIVTIDSLNTSISAIGRWK